MGKRIANIARLYRGEKAENLHDSKELTSESFPDGKYVDVPGLCKAASVEEVEATGWSLNPGRYVGVAEGAPDDFDFLGRLEELNEDLELLNADADTLQQRIADNMARLLEG